MPTVYFDRWKHAQDVFAKSIASLGWKQATPGATDVANALKQVDLDDVKAGDSQEALNKYTASVNKFVQAKNVYSHNLDVSITKATPQNKTAYTNGVHVLQTELKALESTLKVRVATKKSAVDKEDANTMTAKNLIASAEAASHRAVAFAVKAEHEGTAAYFNANVQKAARDMTQQIGNVDKLKAKGFHFQHDEPKDLFNLLKAWGNDNRQVHPSSPQNEKAEVLREINAFKQAAEGVERWAKGEE